LLEKSQGSGKKRLRSGSDASSLGQLTERFLVLVPQYFHWVLLAPHLAPQPVGRVWLPRLSLRVEARVPSTLSSTEAGKLNDEDLQRPLKIR
jgi:hypothetical protein